jgi:hypothetical protein
MRLDRPPASNTPTMGCFILTSAMAQWAKRAKLL